MDAIEALRAFRQAEKRHGLPPSVREYASELKLTSTPAYYRLLALEDEGLLSRVEGARRDRKWTVTKKGERALAKNPAG